jgi:hypothetical protein
VIWVRIPVAPSTKMNQTKYNMKNGELPGKSGIIADENAYSATRTKEDSDDIPYGELEGILAE